MPKLTEDASDRIQAINARLNELERERLALLNERRELRIAPWNIRTGDLVKNTRFGLWKVGQVCAIDEPWSDCSRPRVIVYPLRNDGSLSSKPRRASEHWEKIETLDAGALATESLGSAADAQPAACGAENGTTRNEPVGARPGLEAAPRNRQGVSAAGARAAR